MNTQNDIKESEYDVMRFSVPRTIVMALKSTIVNIVVPTNYFLIHLFHYFLKCIMKIYFLLLFNHVILQSKIPVRRFQNRKDFNGTYDTYDRVVISD